MKDTKIIAVCNQKGGVGKTTTTANLGYAFAKAGKKVLLIDFDSQASLTTYLNIFCNDENEKYWGICELLQREIGDTEYGDAELYSMPYEELLNRCIHKPVYYVRKKNPDKNSDVLVINEPVEFGMDLIPSHLDLSDIEMYISGTNELSGKGLLLNRVVRKILELREYDYVLIDCNPSLGTMTINSLIAARSGVLIPTNLDLMSTRGVQNLINKIVEVQQLMIDPKTGKSLHYGVIGVILNLYRSDRYVDQKIQSDLERYYPFVIFENAIPESSVAKRAVMAGQIYSQLYKKAEDAYIKLAKEIEKQIGKMIAEGPQIKELKIND